MAEAKAPIGIWNFHIFRHRIIRTIISLPRKLVEHSLLRRYGSRAPGGGPFVLSNAIILLYDTFPFAGICC